MTTWRLGVFGAGQVWQRLYRPALRGLPFEVVGIADPAGGEGVTHRDAGELLRSRAVDCVAVLSPPALHGEQVSQSLEHGVAVLVEKPPALSLAAVEEWRSAGENLRVTPAFSRRYWAQYRERGSQGKSWEFRLKTNPASWGARGIEPVERDLLPHAVDLARWLSREEIASVTVEERSDRRIAGQFRLSAGGRFGFEVSHGEAYEEVLVEGGRVRRAEDGKVGRLKQMLRRVPPQDVRGVAALLRDWAAALDGGRAEALPTFGDARANVEAVQMVMETRL